MYGIGRSSINTMSPSVGVSLSRSLVLQNFWRTHSDIFKLLRLGDISDTLRSGNSNNFSAILQIRGAVSFTASCGKTHDHLVEKSPRRIVPKNWGTGVPTITCGPHLFSDTHSSGTKSATSANSSKLWGTGASTRICGQHLF